MRIIQSLLLCCGICMSLYGQQDPYVGQFSSDGDIIRLSLQKEGDQYRGQVTASGVTYPYRANLQEGYLSGTYDYEGYEIVLDFALIEGVYFMESEGMILEMTKSNKSTSGNEAVLSISVPNGQGLPEPRSPITPGGKVVKEPTGTFSFQSPANWNQEQNEGAWVFVPEKQDKEVYVIVTPHQYNDYDAIIREIGPYQDAETATNMTGQYRYIDSQLWVRYTGQTNQQNATVHTLFVPSPFGGGAQLLAIVAGEDTDQEVFRILRGMAQSMRFHKIEESSVARQWRQLLSGKQLLYMNTSGGISDKWSYDLCSDGSFYYQSNTSGMSGGTSVLTYAGQSKNSGSWKIQTEGNQAVLYFYFSDGGASSHRLSAPPNTTQTAHLNDRRYFIQPNNSCN